MFNMINRITLSAYIAAKGYISDIKHKLKTDERGLSGVVVAVLLIVISVLAVLVLWAAMNNLLENWWEKITGETGSGSGGSPGFEVE